MPKVKLNDVAVECKETIKGETGLPVVGLEHLIPGEVCLTQWSDDSDNTFTKRFRKGQVLFGRRRAYLKKAAVAPFDGICSGDITVIAARPEVLEPELLPFIIQNDALFDYAVGHSAGSLSPRVKWEHLKNYEFELPDKSKQSRLARLLWAVEDARKAYQTLIQRSEELVKSQFIEIITPLLEAGKTVRLDDLVEDDRPITYGILKPGTGCPGGVPVIKVKDMRDGVIDQSDLLLTTPELDYQYRRSRLRAGDLLISIRGSVGRMAEVPENLENANITQDTARLTLKPECNKVYVRGVLESEPLQRDMERNIRGVAVKGINIGYLRELGIPICDRSEQDRLALLYQQLDKSKHSAQKALEALQATQKALIRKYLG